MSEGIKERFAIIRENIGLNVKQFAESLNMEPTTVSSIESGKREPSKEVLHNLAVMYNVNLNWIFLGKGNMFISGKTEPSTEDKTPILYQNDFSLFKFSHGHTSPVVAEKTDINSLVLLPVFGQPVSAGSGQGENRLSEIDAYLPIAYELLGGSNPRDCGIARVIGDSMIDMLLFDGDMVIFDRTRLEGNGIYVISVADEMRVKRLEYRIFEKKVVISSENAKRYPEPEIISYEQAENLLRVYGKVICWMHKHPY